MSGIMNFSGIIRPVWAKCVTFQLSFAVVNNGGGGYWIFPANEVQTSRRA